MPAKRKRPAVGPDPADSRYIPGIHEYCDRWCERCDFSHRCHKFAYMESLGGPGASTRRGATQTVFDALGRAFDDAKKELAQIEKVRSTGVDERTLSAGIAIEKRLQRKAQREGVKETKAALTYAHMLDEWFNNELKLPLQYIRSLEKRVRDGSLRVPDAKGDLVRLNDCVEILRWHQHLPYIKLCRAFSSRVEEASTPLKQRDSDGSAKVALLAIDQSVEAWSQLQEMFTEKTDSILEILIHLDRLRRAVLAKFPRARRFKRPGFDEKPIRRRKD